MPYSSRYRADQGERRIWAQNWARSGAVATRRPASTPVFADTSGLSCDDANRQLVSANFMLRALAETALTCSHRGMATTPQPDTITVTLRLPRPVHAALRAIAERERRTLTAQVTLFLERSAEAETVTHATRQAEAGRGG